MTIFKITFYTDTICPWCYIGHKSLEKAIELFQKTYPGGSKDEFVFTFSPFYLDASAPIVGIPWEQRVTEKNGSAMVNAIRTRLQRVGRANGIEFSFNSKIGKTKDSHRLLQYALKAHGHQVHKLLLEKIYEWHFERDGDITSRAGLVGAAQSAGLSREEATKFLESGEGGDEVDTLAAQARETGMANVPTIEINGERIKVDGAGDPHEYYEALVEAKGH